MNKRLILAVLVGSLGGFIFGFDLGAVSAATQSLRAHFSLSPWAFGLTISTSIWGTVLGAVLSGRFADRWDRRRLIAGCALLYASAAGSLLLPVPHAWGVVLVIRLACGIAIGGFTVACPLYLSEIAPIAMRGRVVGAFQVQVGIGVIVAFSVGAAYSHFLPGGTEWTWILGVAAIPAAALVLVARFMPPVAPPVLTAGGNEFDVAPFLVTTATPPQPLFVRANLRVLLIATSVAVFNQLSGVNVLLLYMLEILGSAGVNLSLGHRYTVLVSGLGLATTVLGMTFVDRWGRKPLLYFGSAGMALCLLTLAVAIPHHIDPVMYLSILIAYNVFFAFSQGTVVWVYLSELFPPGLRGPGQGYGSTVHWVTNAILISVFPTVQHASSVAVFYGFAAMMVVQIAVIWFWYPETKGAVLGSFEVL